MQTSVWQRLLALETRDGVGTWFERIHRRQLNARRAMEITSAAKQAREFFRNASRADESVRPLLTYYGVAALTRATVLLLRRSGGEETLTAGHGLETIGWATTLSGDLSAGLGAIDSLKARTTNGLFSEFSHESGNRMCIHVNSAGVDWRLPLPEPAIGTEVSLGDLLARLPDVAGELDRLGRPRKCASINSLTFSLEQGLAAKVRERPFSDFKASYQARGYVVTTSDGWCDVTCPAETFEQFVPQFIHGYVAKTFGSIPSLHIAEPFPGEARWSQLGVTFVLAYFLGMLVRYHPTHWTALFNGSKGDALWPAINLAQTCVEQSFPELVIEFIDDTLGLARSESADTAAESSTGEASTI